MARGVYCAREWLKVEAEMCTCVCVLFTYSLLFVAADSNPRHHITWGLNCHLTIIATTMMNNVYAVRVRDVTMHACFWAQS